MPLVPPCTCVRACVRGVPLSSVDLTSHRDASDIHGRSKEPGLPTDITASGSLFLTHSDHCRRRWGPFRGPCFSWQVPNMGDSITEGTIIEWTKEVGDFVAMDDVVCVIETDKVSVDVRATQSGVLTALHGEVDAVVEVGAPLYSLDTSAAPPAGASDPVASEPKVETPAPTPTPGPAPAAAAGPAASAAPAQAAPAATAAAAPAAEASSGGADRSGELPMNMLCLLRPLLSLS